MIRILLILVLLSIALFAQTTKTIPNTRSSLTIMDAVTATGATTPVWSNAFPITFMEGATAIFFNSDTTGASVAAANQSDSCMTVFLRVKDNTIGWTGLYNESTVYTRLDSVARSISNTGGTHDYRINLADFTAWGAGDSAAIGVTIGVGDSLKVTITRQGF